MIRSTDIQPDTYKSGQFLRRWSISEASGQAVCVEDAYPTADTEQATIDAQSERNAGIRQALADVEALENARRVAEPEGDVPKTATDLTNDFETVRRGKPSETLPVMKTVEETVTDEEGNESTRSVEVVDEEAEPTANPEFAKWQAAWPSVGALNG
jgi:flagellar hook protein FlgE